jgi:hypothetical protein
MPEAVTWEALQRRWRVGAPMAKPAFGHNSGASLHWATSVADGRRAVLKMEPWYTCPRRLATVRGVRARVMDGSIPQLPRLYEQGRVRTLAGVTRGYAVMEYVAGPSLAELGWMKLETSVQRSVQRDVKVSNGQETI